MPRTLDPMLSMVLERANPNVCHFVEVNAPDVGLVLRRGADQFLSSAIAPLAITADPTGALTIASTEATLADYAIADNGNSFLPRPDPSKRLTGFSWQPDITFVRAVVRKFRALIRRKNADVKLDLQLQVYRMEARAGVGDAVVLTPAPLLETPVRWKYDPAGWVADTRYVEFDFSPLHFEVGNLNVPAPSLAFRGEESWYYFSVEPVNASADDLYYWWRDRTSSHVIAGVGRFDDRLWLKAPGDEHNQYGWQLDTTAAAAVPTASLSIENYAATAQATYAIALPAVPAAASLGRIVFEAAVPRGTTATLELSTAGSGGPWTTVKHGDPVTTKQATYHVRVTMTSDATHRLAPRVAAAGIEFKVPVDVTAEAIVRPISQEIEVPFLRSAIGEGDVTIVRAGRRDYRDVASDLAAQYPSSKLEVDVFLGSRHALVTRDKWLHVDRAFVNDRDPSATAERFGLLSYLKVLKRKIPDRIEGVNATRTVTSATASAVTVSADLPDTEDGPYLDKGYYMRVRSSSQPGIESGYVQTIDNSTGLPMRTLVFNAPLPGTLAAGDVIEIHSANYVQQGLTWVDEDPAAIWWQILTEQLAIPTSRIGRADLGRVERSGLPPTVEDRAPGDLETQAKLKVTFATKEAESADELIAQLSFLMGGTTVEIGGQIVFRQIYPLRDVNGQVVVPAEPIAAVFDTRNMAGLSTPTGLEQRHAQIACDYGVNYTAASKDTPPALTANFVDVDAIAFLDNQPFDELAPAAVPDEIARWCYNSADEGLYLASQLTQQVVRATSTGIRVWTWTATELAPQLVIGDRVTVITDQYTDYDPARKFAIRGWWAFPLCIVSVQGGGRQFRGFMLGLTDAVQIRGGAGTLAEDDSEISTEILSVTWKDSVDGTQRTYDIVAGAAVATLFVHHRLWPVGTQGDPYDFSQAQTVDDTPELDIIRPDPADGHFRFTLDHPVRGFQRAILIVPRRAAPSLAFGDDVWKAMLDPAPPATTAKIHAIVVNDKADLEIEIGAGVSDWPVTVDVFEGDPDGIPIVSTALAGPTTLTKLAFPALGNRPLPLRELKYWWVRITNVALEEFWFGPESANRDPLPQGTVTLDHYRADPVFRMVFDTDTDKIRITTPDGRTKTFEDADLTSSPVLYEVGVDPLDDLSTEDALGVDEQRTPYKVEYQGGGQWVTMFGPSGVVRGTPSNPPTARVRVVKNTAGSTEDVFVLPDSSVPEKLRVYFRDGESDLSPVYGLVVSAGDDTPLYVTAGTEIGPANFFSDGIGSPSAKLGGIALTLDQIKRVSIQIEGEDSLVRSSWIPVALSLQDAPWNQAFDLVWDDVNGELVATVVAGARCAFETIQVADNEAFTSPQTDTDNTVVEGDRVIIAFPLSAAQRGKLWYGRAKANNRADNSGIDSAAYDTANVFVPALFDYQPSTAETVTTGTLTIVVDDPGGVLDPSWTNGSITGALHFEVLKNGVKTVEAATTVPGGGATTGTYTKAVTLADHPIQINAYAHLVDGSVRPLGSWMFDSNKVSDIKNATVANNGLVATVTAIWDTDAKIGAATGRYSLNGGGAWTNVAIAADYSMTFAVIRTPAAKQTVLLQAQNAIDSAYGNQATVEVDAYDADQSTQGTVSVGANGAYGFTVNVPPAVASIRWMASTSAHPSAATVIASGTAVNTGGATRITVASAGTLSFGQSVFITIVPFLGTSGTGTSLQAFELQGAFLQTTATKFDTYPGSAFVIGDPYAATVHIDSATGFIKADPGSNPTKAQATLGIKISNGVTVSSVSLYGKFTFTGAGTKRLTVSAHAISKTTGATTAVGQPETNSSSAAVQLVTVSGLSHVVDSNTNTYQAGVLMADSTGTSTALELWSFTIGYTQNNQNQGT